MLNTSLVLFGIFIILLICNIPIAVSLGIASIVSIVVTGLPIEMFPINVFSASSKFSLLAIPFFIVAGNIMEKAGISEKCRLILQRPAWATAKMGSRWCA
ncbi:MAG: TRAP transporter large permease subunit [[Clostridium] scindens]